jgi:hypothetical protein
VLAIVCCAGLPLIEPDRVRRGLGELGHTLAPTSVVGCRLVCCCSYSTGGMSPRLWCSRAALYQPTYSTSASSSCARDRQTRSVISSVLKLSTNDSASALSPL